MPALQSRVRPSPHLIFYWTAFRQLTSDRPVGFGIGEIPWTAVDRYAQRYRIDDPDQFDILLQFVRAMDAVYLDDAARRADRKTDKTEPTS